MPFANPIRGLSLSRRYNIVFASGDIATCCQFNYVDTAPNSGVLQSTGTKRPGRRGNISLRAYLFYRLYGTYSTAGTPYDVTRSRLSSVQVTLQTKEASQSRIEAGISLENKPILVSAVWRADFEPDEEPEELPEEEPNPTAIDLDGNAVPDWAMASGSFNVNNVDEGVWTVNGTLQSRPVNNFADVTCVDARARNGAVLRINADRHPIFVRLTTAGGKQTLTLSGASAASTEKTLATVERLPVDWVRFRLLIVPQQNLVQLKVNDLEIGTYTYPAYTTTTDRFLSISGNGSAFDYVEASVADEATVELVN